MDRLLPFTFQDAAMCPEDSFLLQVPPGLKHKQELLAYLAEAGRFPDYFGFNWDALYGVLRDLFWSPKPNLVIAHADLPMQGMIEEQWTYLKLLRDASNASSAHAEGHVVVGFPVLERSKVLQIMTGTVTNEC